MISSLFLQKDRLQFFPPGEQERTNVACSPRGQVEVSVEYHATTQPPPRPSSLPPLLPLPSPFLWQREPVWLPRKQAFFPRRCRNTWEGQGGFVSPRDEGFSPCMFNRQTYSPRTRRPGLIYHGLIMFNGASDTSLRRFYHAVQLPSPRAPSLLLLGAPDEYSWDHR